jgi:hypothetical protein
MASDLETPLPVIPALPVFGRAATLGAGAGAVVGGVVGTFVIPIAGTFFGVVVGSVVGALVGLVNGLALIGAAKISQSRRAAALAAGATSCLCTAAVLQWSPPGILLIAVVFMTGLGATLGPIAARGARPIRFGPHRRERSPFSLLWTTLGIGAATGVTLGAIVGLIIGIRVHLPTAPAAAVEGGLIGVAVGAVLAMLLGAIVIAPCLRPRA